MVDVRTIGTSVRLKLCKWEHYLDEPGHSYEFLYTIV